eukprot:7494883-Lingulodinium_polyedra.AAC.1
MESLAQFSDEAAIAVSCTPLPPSGRGQRQPAQGQFLGGHTGQGQRPLWFGGAGVRFPHCG